MKKSLYTILLPVGIVFVASAIIIFAFLQIDLTNQDKTNGQTQVCFNNFCFNAEIAQTEAQRSLGLANRQNLPENQGMLFVFEKEGQYSFWMKNTLIALDIIWLDQNQRVVFFNENTQPCKIEICPTISPSRPAKYVLELNAGTIKETGIKNGDQMTFSH